MKFLFALLSSLTLSFLLWYFRFDMEYGIGYVHVLDSVFVVNITYFFVGLLTLSNAGQVLRSTGYALKNMFWARQSKHKTYYDYLQANPRKREKSTGVATMTVGLILSAIVSILAYVI